MKDLLHHLFFPRESNNHRSKLLHHSSLLVIIALLLVSTLSLSFIQHHTQGILGISTNISIDELLSLTNQVRAEKGLAPLQMSGELASAANSKASDMFAKNYWAHNAPDGTPPWVFFKSAGYDYVYAGENLARGFNTAKEVIDAWMASQGHRENLLSPNYKEVGFSIQTGTLTGDETALVVQEFGSRNSVKAASTPQTVVAVLPSPTQAVIQSIGTTPAARITITPTPTIVFVPSPTLVPSTKQLTAVAASRSEPLVNKSLLTKQIAFGLLALFISLLILDMIVVEKNNIVRFVGHNIDHIIFLAILLILVMIITRGAIL